MYQMYHIFFVSMYKQFLTYKLSGNGKFEIVSRQLGDFLHQSSLIVYNVDEHDLGYFICSVKNVYGRDELGIELQRKGKKT